VVEWRFTTYPFKSSFACLFNVGLEFRRFGRVRGFLLPACAQGSITHAVNSSHFFREYSFLRFSFFVNPPLSRIGYRLSFLFLYIKPVGTQKVNQLSAGRKLRRASESSASGTRLIVVHAVTRILCRVPGGRKLRHRWDRGAIARKTRQKNSERDRRNGCASRQGWRWNA